MYSVQNCPVLAQKCAKSMISIEIKVAFGSLRKQCNYLQKTPEVDVDKFHMSCDCVFQFLEECYHTRSNALDIPKRVIWTQSNITLFFLKSSVSHQSIVCTLGRQECLTADTSSQVSETQL